MIHSDSCTSLSVLLISALVGRDESFADTDDRANPASRPLLWHISAEALIVWTDERKKESKAKQSKALSSFFIPPSLTQLTSNPHTIPFLFPFPSHSPYSYLSPSIPYSIPTTIPSIHIHSPSPTLQHTSLPILALQPTLHKSRNFKGPAAAYLMHRDNDLFPRPLIGRPTDATRIAQFCCTSCRAGPYFYFSENRPSSEMSHLRLGDRFRV
jgi:hypothetical protein